MEKFKSILILNKKRQVHTYWPFPIGNEKQALVNITYFVHNFISFIMFFQTSWLQQQTLEV